MQTFLPFADFFKSLRVLDYRRLGKQRVEAFQLLCANGDEWALLERKRRTGKTTAYKGWINHPAAIMWRGYNEALSVYMNICIQEWELRGYNNTMSKRQYLFGEFFSMKDYSNMVEMPHWLGNEDLHASHRSNLLAKDSEFYSKYNWAEAPGMPYYWPNNARVAK